ncbi:MAG: class IV adenylate cyclase [Bacteroidia bacterium]|nr:class IV adenylate cyclase [Bacteroidia bacterium]
MHLNVEIKARTTRHAEIRAYLRTQGADFRGTDRQTDTYFVCPNGRLKLRQGTIENTLIHYERPDQAGPKPSVVRMYHPQDSPALYDLLSSAVGVWKEVRKSREIYFIANVKFHLDEVAGLGQFVEIEAIDHDHSLGQAYIEAQCQAYMTALGIQPEDLLTQSYSDMI